MGLLPKVKIAHVSETLEEKEQRIKENLRHYFSLFHKRRTKRPLTKDGLRFTLFMEPVPYLSLYRKGDESLPMEKNFFTSFRTARYQWIRAITKWRAKVATQLTAASLN